MTADPRRVHIAELRRRPGERRPLRRAVHLEELTVGPTRVPAGTDIDLDLVLEAVVEGLVVEGTVRAPWTGECRRCLEPVTGVVEVEVREPFTNGGDPDETYPIDGDEIDLEPLVRDAVLLHLPLSPLCRDDCRGPAPDRFPAEPADEARDRPSDPRWAALADLRFDD